MHPISKLFRLDFSCHALPCELQLEASLPPLAPSHRLRGRDSNYAHRVLGHHDGRANRSFYESGNAHGATRRSPPADILCNDKEGN